MSNDKYSLFRGAMTGDDEDVIDYVMPYSTRPMGKTLDPKPSRKPASKSTPKKQFNPDNFTTKAPLGGAYNPDNYSMFPGDNSAPKGAYNPDNFTMFPEGSIEEVADNIRNNLDEKSDFVKDLQSASAKDKMQLSGGALASAAITAESQSTSQAVVGGIQTGAATAAALSSFAATSAAAGPVGLAVGGISMLVGMNSAKQAKRAAADQQKKAEKAAQKAEELRLLQNYQKNRQAAINNLSKAFRRNR